MPTPLRQCFLSILFLGTGTLVLLQTLPYLSYRPPQRAPPHATFAPPRPPRLVAIHFGAPRVRVLAKGGPEAVLQAVYYPPALATAHSPYAFTPPPPSGAEPEVRSFVIFAPGVRGGMGPGEGAEALKAGKRGRRDEIWAAKADDAASSYAGGQAGRPGGDNHDTGNNQGPGSGNNHGRGGNLGHNNNHNNIKQPPPPSRRRAAGAFVFVRAATELQRRGVGSLHMQWRTTPLEGGSLRDARQDVRRAVAWLRRQSFGTRVQVVLVGHSFGGAVVWSAGAHASELGVVGAATFATAVRGSAPKGEKDDVLDRAAAARGLAAAAVLVVHGTGDVNLHYQWSQKMFDVANAFVGAETEAGGRAGAGVATRPGAGATDRAGANVAGGSGSGGAGPRATRPARSLVLVKGGTHNFGKSTACLSELLVEWVSSVCGVPVPWRPPRRRDRTRRQYRVRGGERRGAGSDGRGSGARAVQEMYYSPGGCGDGVPRVARGAAQHKTTVLRVLGDLHVIDKPS